MTRDQEPSEGAKSGPLSGFSTMSTSVYAVTEPVMEREARVWPWTCTTVHRNPLACTRSESSLKKTGRHVQEDGKTATQEDGNAALSMEPSTRNAREPSRARDQQGRWWTTRSTRSTRSTKRTRDTEGEAEKLASCTGFWLASA